MECANCGARDSKRLSEYINTCDDETVEVRGYCSECNEWFFTAVFERVSYERYTYTL